MKGGPRKVTVEQQAELLQLYLDKGQESAAVLCAQYGVSPKYAASIAASMGFYRPTYRAGNRYKDNRTDPPSPRSKNDPRWQRAIANGAVIA